MAKGGRKKPSRSKDAALPFKPLMAEPPPRPVQPAEPRRPSEGRPSYLAETFGGGELEPVPGYRAKRAMTAGLFADHAKEDKPVVPQTGDNSAQETVYFDPGDTRVQVEDTARVPWRAVCHLHIVRESGIEEIGTGWLAGPDLVVTAGHNALRHERAGRASAIRITPGHDGTVRPPFPALQPVSIYIPQRWEESGDSTFDYAFIRLANGSIGAQFGYFGFTSGSDAFFQGVFANLPGYPGDKPYGTLWFDAGRLFQVGQTLLAYHIDTEAGCSGAPLFYKNGDQRLVVGMHTQGDPTPNRQRSNRGLRVAQSFLDDLLRATSQ